MSEPMEQESRAEVDEEAIRARAYEISQEEGGGSPEEHWARAERELRGEGRPES